MSPEDANFNIDGIPVSENDLINMATVDGSTSLDTRQFFELYGLRLVKEAKVAGKKKFGAIMIDIDDLKALNSIYGHVGTDSVLLQVGATLKRNLRINRGDKIARYGGDEIVALLPNTSRKGATVAARRLVQKIRDLANEIDVPVSISAGAAEIDPRKEGLESLLKKADAACYEAKKKKDRHLTYRPRQ